MASCSMDELDKFILKFKSLCGAGSNANLVINADAGLLKLSLQVEMKLEHVLETENTPRRKGWSPCKQRRKERREADRKAAAEKVVKVDTESDIHQTDIKGLEPEMKFELRIHAQEGIKNYDIIEAIEENFSGALDDKKVASSDPSRSILVQKSKEKLVSDENGEKISKYIYHISVMDNPQVLDVIENWRKPHLFDDLAFRNAVYGKKQVKIMEIKTI